MLLPKKQRKRKMLQCLYRLTTVKCEEGLASQRTLSSGSLRGSCDVGTPPYVCQMGVDCLGVHGVRMGGYLLAISTRVGAIVVTGIEILLATL